MGTKMAPPYANLFMGRLEKPIVESHEEFLLLWKRFIDDIFFIFLGTMEELESLKNFMNSQHPTIKFKFETSTTSIPFLDLQIYITEDRRLATTLYKKPTDCSPLLHFKSNHSLKCKESVIYTQALRYNLIISDDNLLQNELHNLTKTLIAREFPLKIINRNINKALSHSRDELLKETPRNNNNKILPIITPYSQKGISLSQHIHNQWHLIENDENLSKIWPQKPITAYSRTHNLKDKLVHSKQNTQSHSPTP